MMDSFFAPVEPAFLSNLNPPQREAVLTTEGPVLMLAGAGTGKTAALTARLAWLVNQKLAWPSEILCVTFTNKAAREMRERVGHLLGPSVETMPWLGTFHAIAAKMLRRHAEAVGLTSNFTIIDPDDQLRLLKQIITSEGLDEKANPAKLLAACIDRWKNRGLTPEDIGAGEAEAFANGKGQHFYRAYQNRLISLGACDFGDLMLQMLTILRTHRDVLETWQRRFKYIMVDEYQDTNQVQYLWLRLLAQGAGERRHNICVVGDDDQSIYSWRGAEVANILRFEKDFPGAKIIRLEQNYRSTKPILAAASGLIDANQERLGKNLWTEKQGGDKLRVIGVWDAGEEARRTGEDIERLACEGASLSEVAILVRAQFQTRELEDRFIASGLAYRIVGGFRFYERSEIRDALAYLRLIAQNSDDLAFERIVNVPRRGIGAKAMEELRKLSILRAVPLLAAAGACAAGHADALPVSISAKSRGTLAALASDFARWREAVNDRSPADLLRMVLEESNYTPMLQAERSVEAGSRLENLTELARAMEDYDTLGDFLEHVSLIMDNEADDRAEKVTIMTMHAAKGLEFDNIFLPGWEEGVFPSQRALDGGGIKALEEERRLAYVAITRARRRCTILHAANRRIYGQWNSATPSRFIEELPDAYITHESTLSGGASLKRSAWNEMADSFTNITHAKPERAETRGPGWERAAARDVAPTVHRVTQTQRIQKPLRTAASFASRARLDIKVGDRIEHDTLGTGIVMAQEGNKLDVHFDSGDHKRLIDSYVRPAV